ncbi:MAG: hypothetical protein O2797_00975 [Bacteroidetes bacterium]|nr:hypothetical protein [Bacteroidota bacterium]MDA1332771.1 hypothetical protein [Bacteroidota bacterium]
MSSPTRRYSDKEIGLLIQRATELHEERAGSPARSLSLADAEHIAEELGVSKDFVHTAALEMERGVHRKKSFSLFGGPFREIAADSIDVELTDEIWEEIVLDMRRLTGSSGKVEQIGRLREWKKELKDMDLVLYRFQVSAMARDGKTQIEVEKQFGGMAFLSFVVSLAAGFALAGIAMDGSGLPPEVVFPIAAGSGAGFLVMARAALRLRARQHQARVQEILGRVRNLFPASSDGGLDAQHVSDAASVISDEAGRIVLDEEEPSPDQSLLYHDRNRDR